MINSPTPEKVLYIETEIGLQSASKTIIMVKQKKSSKTEEADPYSTRLIMNSQFFKIEARFRNFLTPKPDLISNETDPLPRLQYMPEYITDLICKKKKLKKKCEQMPQDNKYLERYNNVRQEIRSWIRLHAAVLKWFDMITEPDQTGNKNHFSTSLDVARVESLINDFREHEHEPLHIARMMMTKEYTKDLITGKVLKDKSEAIHFHYYWYALFATYEDFVLAHPDYRENFICHKIERDWYNILQKEHKRQKSSWSHLVQKYNLRKNPR